jgi:SAM-dependent methyltransferase
VARNVGFKLAYGDVIIAQSDEVVHVTPDCIDRLVNDLTPSHMLFANVFCRDEKENVCGVFIGPTRKEPFFFLGSLFREDLYAVGGNDEEFIVCPAWEDNWFGDCLTRGRGLVPVYTTHIVAHHLFHEYFSPQDCQGPSKNLYYQKKDAAEKGKIKWEASGGPWPYLANQPYKAPSTEEIFTAIYKHSVWGKGTESLSGAGSSLDATQKLRQELPRLIRDRKIKSVLDIPCGDWHWMREVDLARVRYTGADVVLDLIESLKQHELKNRKFRHLDLLFDKLPKVDLVFCRDCLGHLSPADVERALTNIVKSGSKYLLATTFPPRESNRGIQTGDWTPYNLQAPPFNLPEPVEIINEDCREYYPDFNDKSMALWNVADLDRPVVIKSLVVCVEYDDFLAVALPRNMRHFSRTLIVTSPADTRTQELAKRCGAECHVTDAFYRDGAAFNKGAAIEEAFDVLGRDGWICVWDADVVMPDSMDVPSMSRNCLYVPIRRLLEHPKEFSDDLDWGNLASPTQPNEFDGYCQIFHASAIEDKPWYGVDWSHAGGGDSDFQSKFPEANRRRAPFEVLHLGTEGIKELGSRVGLNWRGRVTPRIDTGEVANDADKRKTAVCQMVRERERRGPAGEKLQVGTMPRRISFFWHGRMSWMRYLTLASFRRHNLDWEICLYSPAEPCGTRQWQTSERDDAAYAGEDYRDRLGDIGVECREYSVPIPGVAPAQASDLFQWDMLGREGGFYADMDILWLKPLESLRKQVKDADAVFCLEAGVLAIGFLAANRQCRIFSDIAKESGDVSDYQGFGTHLLLRKFKDKNGQALIETLRHKYPELKIATVPDETVYPFDWREIEKIFTDDLTPPAASYGLHWFGGSELTQKWNRKLTAENYREYTNTFANCVRLSMGERG